MDLPENKSARSPRDRFRNILSAEKDEEGSREPRKPAVVNLPKVGSEAAPRSGDLEKDLDRRGGSRRPAPGLAMRRLWTVGAILSILANIVLLALFVGPWTGMRALSSIGGGEAGLVGLYASLEQLDEAHIRATLPIQTDVLLDAVVPVSSSTNITLAEDVRVQGAHVTISTALFNIDAPANITLPAGTSLDVALDMALPLKTTVPVTMNVPVDIAIRDTDLHGAIQGLKDSLRPAVCGAAPLATLPDGSPICR